MYAVKAPDTEPIPGYRLLEPLGRGGYGEVWKCVAPGGLIKAIKFVAASDSISDVGCAATQELQAIQHIKAIRHPFILSIERVEVIDGELIIVMELADRSLFDLLNDYRKAGSPGIPRDELIGYLHDAAEALDLLNLEHGLQHLDVKPKNLFLVGRHVKVADFGLVNSLAAIHGSSPHAVQLGAATPLYASPESFLNRITLFSDQYSLAISYCEMLTGIPPFTGKNFRQLALQHTGMEPDLSRLPDHDRSIVGRSLDKEPGNRFPSCLEFVHALEAASPPRLLPSAPTPSRLKRSLKMSTNVALKIEKASVTPVMSTAQTLPPPERGAACEAPASLASYQFLECLARLPIGEVWKGRSPGGHRCLIKLVFGCQAAEDETNDGAVARLSTLRHNGLEPFLVLRDGPNRIALICDERDGSLADRLQTVRASGQAGLPHPELLRYMRRAADTLDYLYRQHGLQHLTLNPRSLLLDRGDLRIADFGLAELIWLPAGLDPGKLNPRYAPPELFEGRVVPASDQYSLALIFQELLTGFNAFGNLTPRQLATPRLRGRPDLDLLPAPLREVVACAIDPEPEARFPNSLAFVAALEQAENQPKRASSTKVSVVQVASPQIVPAAAPLPSVLTGAGSENLVKQLLGEAMNGAGIRELKGFRYRVIPNVLMEHQFTARFLQGTLPIKLEGFRRHWLAKVIESGDNEVVYHITPPTKGIQRLLGRMPGLRLQVGYGNNPAAADVVGVSVNLQPLPRGEHLLEELGPRIFDSIRQFLQAVPDRRREERFRLGKSLRILPVFEQNEVGEGVVAQALDISLTGFGFFLPCRPVSANLLLEIGTGTSLPQTLAASIVRSDRCQDGRYLIGVSIGETKSATPDLETLLAPRSP